MGRLRSAMSLSSFETSQAARAAPARATAGRQRRSTAPETSALAAANRSVPSSITPRAG